MRTNFLATGLMSSAAIVCTVAAAQPALAQTKAFNLPAQPAAQGIPAFAAQAGVKIVASGRQTAGKRTRAVRGEMSVDRALDLLLQGTGLTARATGSQTYAVVPLDRVASAAPVKLALATEQALIAQDDVRSTAGGPAEAVADAGQEDIVVTANRREESVQDVASAVTAIGQAEIEKRGMDSFESFARSVPGLTMNQSVRNRAAFNIRGVSTNLTGSNTQDPVSVYINETPVSDTFGASVQPDLRLFDVERIEVLRGPQGTLFGSGSLGGTIRIITNKPDTSRFEAAGRVDLGTTEHGGMRQRYDAMVNIPLVDDTLAIRAVGYYRDEEGWVRNVTLGTRNDTVDWGARVALRWTPTSNLTVTATGIHQESDPEDGDSWNPALGKFRRSSAISEGRPLNLDNLNLTIDYDIDGFATLTSSSTYQSSKTAVRGDLGPLLGAGTPNFISDSDPWASRYYVQELRLVSNTRSRLEWVLGAFYINRRTDVDYLITAPGLDDFFGGIIGSDLYFASPITTKSSELAAYADGSYEIFDGLKIHAGARVFRTTADYIEDGRVALNFGTLAYDPPLFFANNSKGTNLTWRAGLSYQPDNDLLFYGNVSKGFRVGQVNANFGPSPVDPTDYVIPEGYDPDSTINYELGAKTSFLDNRLTVNIAAYHIAWSNIQIDGTRISDFRTFIANAGKAHITGVEAEINAKPVRGLNLYATATVQGGKIDSVPADIIVPAAEGDRLPGLAKLKLSGGAEYRWDLSRNYEAYVRVDGQYTGKTPNDFANSGLNPFYAINDDFTSIDASIGLDTAWGNVALYGENLTDNDAIILKTLSSPNPYNTLRPRTFGIRLTYRH
ncbi:TonB-dependent receptor [Sphingosinicella rhizophila]|uniref:TonB-dependent receptor n=1 Tax=Sphingosinicella rhizophila TaxID=3050082 RepID=A0ABU3Q9Y2_9SPHN|nr:TonB-dependent receptor [Sphingosinicella sp. GR2756]MDT9600117.1 TonB-dependent receptor [Sphingosinicella sp. GR2756]